MEQLASLLLHSQIQTHVYHLRVKGQGSYAAHKALQEYYEAIGDLVDSIVEAYQGKNDLIEFLPARELDNNADVNNIVSYLDKLSSAVEKLRKESNLQDSFLQNEIDNVVTLIYQTKYKLVNLS